LQGVLAVTDEPLVSVDCPESTTNPPPPLGPPLQGVLAVTDEPLVSVDFRVLGRVAPPFDASLAMAMG